MKRTLLRSEAFVRAAKRLAKKDANAIEGLRIALELLAEDAFHPQLKTHKLTGNLAGCWACSAGYDLRIVFELVKQDDGEAILLLTTGTHDEVY